MVVEPCVPPEGCVLLGEESPCAWLLPVALLPVLVLVLLLLFVLVCAGAALLVWVVVVVIGRSQGRN